MKRGKKKSSKKNGLISKKNKPKKRLKNSRVFKKKKINLKARHFIQIHNQKKNYYKKSPSPSPLNKKQKSSSKKNIIKPIKEKGFFTRLKEKFFPKKEIKKVLPKKILPKKIIQKQSKKEYIQTGITGFDSLFSSGQGIPRGASVLIEGGPGSGKTIFCLSTVYNLCKKGKKCLYMSFEESESQLINHMGKFNWKVKKFIKENRLRVTRFDAIDVSRSIEALLSAAKKELLIDVDPVFFPRDFQPDFVIIDSLTSIASAFSGQESRFRIYMEQLFKYLEKNGITNFLVREVSSPSHIGTTFKEQGEAVSFLSDGIIVLYNIIYDSGKREFATEILKMRGVDFQKKIIKMNILNKKGMIVEPNKIITKSKKQNFKLT